TLDVPEGVAGPVVDTSEYVFLPGTLETEVTLVGPGAPDAGPDVGTLHAIEAKSNEILAERSMPLAAGAAGLQNVAVSLTIPGDGARRIRFGVLSTGRGGWRLASLGARVDYGMEVLDLAALLNTF